MTMKKILCALIAMAVVLSCFVCALAEQDLQAELDAANAKIEELQALVDAYYPYYMAQIAATYGEDGIIWIKDVEQQYAAVEQQYSAYGISLKDYGMEASVKQDIVNSMVSEAIQLGKADELGISEMSEDEVAALESSAQQAIDYYQGYYLSSTYPDTAEFTEEQMQEAADYWASNGLTYDTYYADQLRSVVLDKVYDYITADVAIDEDDVQQAYEGMVADDQTTYESSDRSYNNARSSGTAIAYNPEGYRAVKHVLIKFDDEQDAMYSDLQSQLSSLNAELETINAVAAGEQEPEEGVELRTAEEVNADIAACATETEALYAQLLPEAQEVVDAFNAGTSFDELIEKYNDDPGMMSGVSAEIGYAVKEGSDAWDPAFTAGAMSIAEIGGISQPVYGSYGIHIIYYWQDVTPGAVALEEIRDSVEEIALADKTQATFDDQIAAWMEEANVVINDEALAA